VNELASSFAYGVSNGSSRELKHKRVSPPFVRSEPFRDYINAEKGVSDFY